MPLLNSLSRLLSATFALFMLDSQLGCGATSVDFLAQVSSFPNPDDEIRTIASKVQGGGNAGNALTCASRLGLHARLISKVASDSHGKIILEGLESDAVDTSFAIISQTGISPFTYVIVDNQTKTRTCIHTPGHPPANADDLSPSAISAALEGARILYSDGRLPEIALLIAKEAFCHNIPILVDAERKREGLDDLLKFAMYVVCSAKFPKAWTEATSIPKALVSILLNLPRLKFVVVTLGEAGCLMVERSVDETADLEEVDVDQLFESLMLKKDDALTKPICSSSLNFKLRANGIGTICGRLFVGTAEKIPPSEIVDTTGAGDAFIGAVLYAICASMPPEKMLPFASQVAACGCRALGARAGLPFRTDPRLAPFLM